MATQVVTPRIWRLDACLAGHTLLAREAAEAAGAQDSGRPIG